jgi:ketosteroid isomerase-like protein
VSQEPTTLDPLKAIRESIEALNRRDPSAAAVIWSPDGKFDLSPLGLGVFEGRQAIRGFLEDWLAPYADVKLELSELRDLGNGVTFHAVRQRGQPARGTGVVELHHAYPATWAHGLIERATAYPDIDEARAAAERLAQERGDADEPVTLDPVEQTRQRWEATSRGEFDPQGLADDYASDAVLDTAGYGMGTFEGRDAICRFLAEWAGSFDALTAEAEEIVGFGNAVVLSVYRQKGRALGANDYVRVRSAMVGEFVDGKIARNTIYTEAEIDQARADAERLAQERGVGGVGGSRGPGPAVIMHV